MEDLKDASVEEDLDQLLEAVPTMSMDCTAFR